jgi:hypothetical protein
VNSGFVKGRIIALQWCQAEDISAMAKAHSEEGHSHSKQGKKSFHQAELWGLQKLPKALH